MNTVLVVLRGGPFDGRELAVANWPEPLTLETMPEDLHVEARVRARYLAREVADGSGGRREMVWDGAYRVGGIHHG